VEDAFTLQLPLLACWLAGGAVAPNATAGRLGCADANPAPGLEHALAVTNASTVAPRTFDIRRILVPLIEITGIPPADG
jgi:hypothetical protein